MKTGNKAIAIKVPEATVPNKTLFSVAEVLDVALDNVVVSKSGNSTTILVIIEQGYEMTADKINGLTAVLNISVDDIAGIIAGKNARYNLVLPEDKLFLLSALAERRGTTMVDVIREAITLWLYYNDICENGGQVLVKRADGTIVELAVGLF